MWQIAEPERPEPIRSGPEHDQLESWLDYYRTTLVKKCAGLSVEQLVERPVASSDLSLLGLIRHLSVVEQYWFEVVFAHRTVEAYYRDDSDVDADFHDLSDASLDEVMSTFDAACAHSRECARGQNLATPSPPSRAGRDVTLRWIYLHMIEEYARHCGHADLLRELIDGVTGD